MYRYTEAFARADALEPDFEIFEPVVEFEADHVCGPACECDDHDHDGHFHLYPHDEVDPLKDVEEGSLSIFDTFGGIVRSPDGVSDLPAGPTTSVTLVDSIAYGGELEIVGDRDWYAVDVVAGETYRIVLLGEDFTRSDSTVATALNDTYLYLVDAAGNIIAQDDDSGAGLFSALIFEADTTQTLYVVAGAYNDGEAGGYTVEIENTALRDYSVDEIADYLLTRSGGVQARSWADTTITYNIDAIIARDTAEGTNVEAVIRQAFAEFEAVSELVFVQTSGTANLTFQDTASGAYASTGSSGGTITSSTINVSFDQWIGSYGDDFYSYTLQTYIHEIGHALGLGHGGPYNGSATYGVDNVYLNDTWGTTVMSYFNQSTAGFGTRTYTVGLQAADIVAIQTSYGVNTTTRAGDTVYGFNTTESNWLYDFANLEAEGIRVPSFSIYDTGGIDTFDVSGYSSDQRVSLVIDTWSDVGHRLMYSNGTTGGDAVINAVSIARGTVIENAIGGSGDDTFVGNDADNVLTGNAGDDTFTGGLGDDTFIGGDGTDTAIFAGDFSAYTITDNGDGTFTVVGPDGTDTVEGVEFAQFDDQLVDFGDLPSTSIDGTPAGDVLIGTAGDDVINGFAGNDTLRGLEGADVMNGGAGDDVFIVDSTDTVRGGDGFDSLTPEDNFAALTLVLDAQSSIENIVGSYLDDTINASASDVGVIVYASLGNDTITGSDFADNISGVSGDDIINAGAGDDFIDASTGTDIIDAGTGNDTIYADEFDTVDGGAGTDTLLIQGYSLGGIYDLAAMNIEIAYGNNSDDVFDGANATDTLIIISGLGNDTLIGGSGADQLYGQGGDDSLVGGAGDDVLNAGLGSDFLDGGAGNDIIFIDEFDTLIDAGDGLDGVYAYSNSGAVTLDLFATNVEIASGSQQGDTLDATGADWTVILQGYGGDDVLTGGTGDDVLYGYDDNDTLTGGGGSDYMLGSTGTDTFAVGAQSGWNLLIGDFENGSETIDLSGTGIASLSQFTIVDLGSYGSRLVRNGTTDSITLVGVDASDIDASDFVFGANSQTAESAPATMSATELAVWMDAGLADVDIDAFI